MSECPLVIIKLGGAALTDKSSYRTAKPVDIGKLATALGRTFATSGNKFIIVHGAGSFGHFEAREAAINSRKPEDTTKKTPLAIARTCSSLTALNSQVLDALIHENIPAIHVPVHPRGEFVRATIAALKEGFVPVLHGDVVLDDDIRARVLSGDEIIKSLTANFAEFQKTIGFSPAVRVVFVTGAPGIFKQAPVSGGAAHLLRHIFVSTYKKDTGFSYDSDEKSSVMAALVDSGCVEGVIETSITLPEPDGASCDVKDVADTTGGIVAKLHTAVQLVSLHVFEYKDAPLSELPCVDAHVIGAALTVEELSACFLGSTLKGDLLRVIGTHIFAR